MKQKNQIQNMTDICKPENKAQSIVANEVDAA